MPAVLAFPVAVQDELSGLALELTQHLPIVDVKNIGMIFFSGRAAVGGAHGLNIVAQMEDEVGR